MSFHVKWVLRVLIVVLLPFGLSGCGGGSGDGTSATQLSFSLTYPATASVAADELDLLQATLLADGVETVLALEAEGDLVLPASAGSNRTLSLLLNRLDGRGYYEATVEGIEITEGMVTSLGAITLNTVVADAGGDHFYNTGSLVQLDAISATLSDGTPLNYSWEIIEKPAGSAAVLSATNTARTDFTSDIDGTYRLKLTMNDGGDEYFDESVIRTETLPTTYTDSTTGMHFTLVPGGCFTMGDATSIPYPNEKPEHEVCVDSFYMGTFEVTQGEWVSLMGEGNNPSKVDDVTELPPGGLYPVENVSWDDAIGYIAELTGGTGLSYRLPTEAEWEYAARSGGKEEVWSGSNWVPTTAEWEAADLDPEQWFLSGFEDEVANFAWFKGSNSHPVGELFPNGLGLYDMSGNVYEWIQDWYDSTYVTGEDYPYYTDSPRDNPQGPVDGTKKVVRSGWFKGTIENVRTTARAGYKPTWNLIGMVGFRLALPVTEVLGE